MVLDVFVPQMVEQLFEVPKIMLQDRISQWTVKEEKLLSVENKNAVENRRAAWRVITCVEPKKKFKGKKHLTSFAREYVAEVEGKLQEIRNGIFALMDKKLVPSAGTGFQQFRLFAVHLSVRICLDFVFVNFRLSFAEKLLSLSVPQSSNLCISNI